MILPDRGELHVIVIQTEGAKAAHRGHNHFTSRGFVLPRPRRTCACAGPNRVGDQAVRRQMGRRQNCRHDGRPDLAEISEPMPRSNGGRSSRDDRCTGYDNGRSGCYYGSTRADAGVRASGEHACPADSRRPRLQHRQLPRPWRPQAMRFSQAPCRVNIRLCRRGRHACRPVSINIIPTTPATATAALNGYRKAAVTTASATPASRADRRAA